MKKALYVFAYKAFVLCIVKRSARKTCARLQSCEKLQKCIEHFAKCCI